MKCKVCRKRFRLLAKNKYIVIERIGSLGILTKAPKEFEAFDCPACGCQNIVNVRENIKIESEDIIESERSLKSEAKKS